MAFFLPLLSFAQDAETEGATLQQNIDTSETNQELTITPLVEPEKKHKHAIAIDFGAQGVDWTTAIASTDILQHIWAS